MNKEGWISETVKAYQEQNGTLSSTEQSMLLREISESDQEQMSVVSRTYDVFGKHFLNKATNGETFGSIERVKQKYGKTLEQNYRLKPGPFLSFAKTYWTYKIEVDDLSSQFTGLALTRILSEVERDIGSLFFPMPGIQFIPNEERRKTQTEFLRQLAPEIEIERFMRENPFLR
jgi:hypothetical protein